MAGAEGAWECGGLTPPFDRRVADGRLWRFQSGVKPPHSKALRAIPWFQGHPPADGHEGLL